MSRILFVSSIYPRSYDMTRGIYCYHMCRALSSQHSVMVVSPRSWLEAITRPEPGSASEIVAVGQTDYPTYFFIPKLLHSRLGWFMWTSIRRKLQRTASEFQPDCVLSYWAHPDGEVAVRIGRKMRIPVGIVVGGSDVLLLSRNQSRGRAVTRALQGATCIFAVSSDIRNRIIELGVDQERVHVIPRGVDDQFSPGDRTAARERLGLPTDGQLLLWVGRMDPVKGLEVLLAAADRLTNRKVEFTLVLIGDGPLRNSIKSEIRRRGLTERVQLTGVVQHHQLPDWYRAADLSVITSHSEGIPNVLRESLACGTPYVATNVGGIPELSDDPAVKLVPPADADAFAAAVESSLSDRRSLRSTTIGSWQVYVNSLLQLLLPKGHSRDVVESPNETDIEA